MITLKDVNKYYNKGKKNEVRAINNASIEFPKKGLIVLYGASGSGKTTLLNVISGLDDFDSGTITFDQYVMKKRNMSKWDGIRNNTIGYVFQNYSLLQDRTVYRNLEIVLRISGITKAEEIDRRIDYSLRCLNMQNYKYRLARELSGGQQQRVSIARVISKNPKVIIADEPTGNLDSKNAVDIMNIIKIISESRLVILVTHSLELARYYADRIIQLEDGTIISDTVNNSSGLLQVIHDQNIYLKDLSATHFDNDTLQIDRYTDSIELQDVPIQVQLINRNETLYIKVESRDHQKVKYLHNDSEIRLIDGHQELENAADERIMYDPEQLKRDGSGTLKGSSIHFKDFLSIAVFKVKKITKQNRLVYFSFALVGALFAFCIGILTQIYTIDDTQFVDYPREYLIVESAEPNFVLASQLENHSSIDEVSLIQKSNNLVFELPSYYQTSNQYSFHVFISDMNLLEEEDIEYGRLPESIHEIVVDRLVISNLIEQFKHIGINSIEDVLNESVKLNSDIDFISFEIVGISNLDSPTVYGTEMLKYTQLQIYPFSLVENFSLVEGRLPEGSGEILVSDQNNPENDKVLIGSKGYNVVGKYDSSEGVQGVYFSTDKFVKKYHYDELTQGARRNGLLVYSNNPDETISYLSSLGFSAKNAYDMSYETYRSAKIESFQGLLIFCAIGISVSSISIFFITRSDLLNRIREISVFRLLGSTKGDLIWVFTLEIILITTISSFLGYMLMVGFLLRLQAEIAIIITYVSLPFSVIAGGIFMLYAINLFFGLLPVVLLLRHTPSQIAKKYDL